MHFLPGTNRSNSGPEEVGVSQTTEEAAARLRHAILEGDFQPGARLGEAALAEKFAVSRTPVREALRLLAAEGLVEISPNRGARVKEWSAEALEEIYELRTLLESHAAERAAARISAADAKVLGQLCDEMDSWSAPGIKRDLDRLSALNTEFHRLILQAAASPRLSLMLAAVVQVPLVLRTFHSYKPEELARSLSHHRELAAALTAGDAQWAGTVMRSHILAAKAAVLESSRSRSNSVGGRPGAGASGRPISIESNAR
jgi:DNA-binding GntR family transcriptional regulator